MLASLALALALQTPTPGVDCSLLTAQQAQGLVCATPPQRSVITRFEPSDETCRDLNPYAEPAQAAACVAWDRARRGEPALPTFTVGAAYDHPYPPTRMVVLAVSLTLDGVPVVTAQYTAGERAGDVFAFRVDQAQPWIAR